MFLDELKDYYGTWRKMRESLKLGETTYHNWRMRGGIPMRSQLLIEHQTNGRFKASTEHVPKRNN